jgi:hypothetical protein
MTSPASQPEPETAAIAYGARTSILVMAWVGLSGFAAILAFALYMAISGIEEGTPFESRLLVGAVSALGLYGTYGIWVFLKLRRCGRKLTPDGEQLAEAMELHRQFWVHAPFVSALSACGIPLTLAILWPGFQGR